MLSLAFSGCEPTEISEVRFQARAQTCYPLPEAPDGGAEGSTRPSTYLPEGCEPEPEPALPRNGAGAGSASALGSNGAALPASTAPRGAASGDAGTAEANGGASGANSLGASGPPCDATQIFSKPVKQGGCQDPETGGCHESGGTGVKPDLVSMGVGLRLLGGFSQQKADDKCAGFEPSRRTWITRNVDRTGSFLWNKITSTEANPPLCGSPMPDDAEPLGDADKQCIGAWLEWIAAGGQ